MDIGIYGHSIASWKYRQDFSYITKLQNHYNANIVHTGSLCCSEERILYELKKTKKLDVAIIFHASPAYLFVPSWTRDVNSLDKDILVKKFQIPDNYDPHELAKNKELLSITADMAANRNVPNDAFHIRFQLDIMNQIPNMAAFDVVDDVLKYHGINYQEVITLWNEKGINAVKELVQQHIDNKEFYAELIDALTLNKKYLYNPELQQNRYTGALIQIDQYLKYKNIPAIHCLGKPFWYPKWVQFTSGIVDYELSKFQKNEYTDRYSSSNNGVSIEGNEIMFNKLVDLINAARSKEVIR